MPDVKFNFEAASTQLTPASRRSVDELAQFLKSNPEARVIHIEGFADTTGNASANENLSANRARVIKDALVAKGIDANRIETSGMGDEQPGRPQRQRSRSRPESSRRSDAGALKEPEELIHRPWRFAQETPEKRRT